MKNKNGFTLFETLVVISIIVLITAAVMVNFSGISQKARDGRRKSDLEKIRTALEMYRQVVGVYPSTGTDMTPTGLVPDYIQALPTDPKAGYLYVYERDPGSAYKYTLDAYLEVEGGSEVPVNCRVSPQVYCNYRMTNP